MNESQRAWSDDDLELFLTEFERQIDFLSAESRDVTFRARRISEQHAVYIEALTPVGVMTFTAHETDGRVRVEQRRMDGDLRYHLDLLQADVKPIVAARSMAWGLTNDVHRSLDVYSGAEQRMRKHESNWAEVGF